MGIRSLSSMTIDLPVGGLWVIDVQVTDLDGYLVDGSPSVVVTLPNGSTVEPTITNVTTGRYRATYEPALAGRFVALVSSDYGSIGFVAWVSSTTIATGMPTVADVNDYFGEDLTSCTDDEKQKALDAEAAAQRAVCRVGAVYPLDLREALLRRVYINLSRRRQMAEDITGDAGLGFRPGRDPEVRRLEAPHRKLVVG